MKICCCVYVLFCCLWGLVSAQVPGYAGKRYLLNTDANVSIAFRPLNRNQTAPWTLNYRLGLELERVLSRRFSGVLSGNYLATDFGYDSGSLGQAGTGRIQSLDFTLGLRHYSFLRRGNPAPLGPYQQIELMYLRYRMTDSDQRFYPDGREALGEYTDMGIAISLGTQRVVFEWMTWHLGIRIGTVLGLNNASLSPEQQELKRIAATRLQGHFLFSLNFGVGLLLF